MSYTPVWTHSPFKHVQYTLVRNQEQMTTLMGDKTDALFKDGTIPACVTTWRVINDKTYCVVQIGESWNWSIHYLMSTLVHEAVHIWQAIKTAMDEINPSDEFEAYSIEDVFGKLFEQYLASEQAAFTMRRGSHILNRKLGANHG